MYWSPFAEIYRNYHQFYKLATNAYYTYARIEKLKHIFVEVLVFISLLLFWQKRGIVDVQFSED